MVFKEENCVGCGESQHCKGLYERLGRATGRGVAMKAIRAFVLPIVVFITALVVFEKTLAGLIGDENLQIAMSAVFAAIITFVYLLITKAVAGYLVRNRDLPCSKGE